MADDQRQDAESVALTDRERDVLDLLSDASRAFFGLPGHHPSDKQEWAHEMHLLQQRVMCRVAVRAHPDYFTPMTQSDGRIADGR